MWAALPSGFEKGCYTPRVAAPPDDRSRLGPTSRADTGAGDSAAGSPDDGETRLVPESSSDSDPRRRGPTTSAPPKSVTSSSGWLTSSGSISHGRFDPGTLLGGRYRIVGRLGRGGMGEVYRADDLKLGQPVALKFLPPDLDRDPARLTQLHTEVRMARQVSHPNVCRVYDIDEVDGQTFLSMEYVDGEDLSALLRRIGRFPEERGLEIARQICAGLASAHDRGVVHRDFKPANVMLDGAGQVRITDFGLAGAAGESLRAGTPAYMAPEQLAGGEVTRRSDIYALGLVLYEMFTGQRALEGKNLAELIHKRQQMAIVPPSALVRDLSQQVETTIMQCLRPEPIERPASALAVSAALPGGDPLAAALAAGETPSPEMVAAAGGAQAISFHYAVAGAVWIALSLAVLLPMYQRVMLINRVPAPKSPDALQDRAVEALSTLGYGPGADSAWGLGVSLDYARYVARTSSAPDRWNSLAAERPAALYLWYRTSPRPLVPLGTENDITGSNPPRTVAGMTLVAVDTSGRLAEFVAVPDPVQPEGAAPPVNWQRLFDAAGLPASSFTPVAPGWVPTTFADTRMAWEGRLPDQPEHLFRVEAASFAGKPVAFFLSGPWSHSARSAPAPPPFFNVVIQNLAGIVMPGLMLAAALLARYNVKRGRGDRRGAFRAATIVFLASLGAWIIGRSHVGMVSADLERLFGAIARGLFDAGLLWLTYLGLEPYVRRHSPDSLIGWTRLIAGRWRDPRVNRDVMIGVCAGLAMTLLYAAHNLIPPLFGRPEPMPISMDTDLLLGTRVVIGRLIERIVNAVSSSMLGVVGIVALLHWLKRPWLAAIAAIVCFTPVVIAGMFPPGTPVLDVLIGASICAAFVVIIVRFGLLATMAALATHFVLLRAPLTTEFASWRGPAGLWFLGTVAVLGLGACYLARAGPAPVARTYEQAQPV
jgi:serine/threonine-protein kinase